MYRKFKITVCIALSFALINLTVSNIRSYTAETVPAADYIKWVDFGVSANALSDAYKLAAASFGTEHYLPFVQSLAYLGAKYGGDFSRYKSADLKSLASRIEDGENFDGIVSGMKYYPYYSQAYGAVLDGFVGEYTDADGEKKFGLCVYSPIASGYYYGDCDDFGNARSFGYKRKHLGHDMMGSVGTPIVAVESGYVEQCGWNMYGGWRVGIRSFDGKRYYYYAHLRKDHPYNDIYEGKYVNAGEVIGYLGLTGYSREENVNNIQTPHLHFGMQLIFDKSQKDGVGEIWIDVYQICRFLQSHRSEVYYDKDKKEYYAKNPILVEGVPD